MVKVIPIETARHLDNPEVIAGYLSEAFQSGDEKLILRAIHNIARAQNISKIARKVGMSRTSLYWKENTKPEFTTVLKVLSAVGVRLQPAIGGGAPKRTSPRGRKGRGQTAPDHAHK